MDGVDTIIRMATSYGSDIGLSAQSMIAALLLTQFIGFPATLAFGQGILTDLVINNLFHLRLSST